MKGTFHRAFTLLELMTALSISAVMLTAIGGLLTSVWMLTKESSDEIQCALRSCALRNMLMHKIRNSGGTLVGFGLLNATNITSSIDGLKAVSNWTDNGKPLEWQVSFSDSTSTAFYHLDVDVMRTRPDRTGRPIQHVYLKINDGKSTFYERLIVPLAGTADAFLDKVSGLPEFQNGIGGLDWDYPK